MASLPEIVFPENLVLLVISSSSLFTPRVSPSGGGRGLRKPTQCHPWPSALPPPTRATRRDSRQEPIKSFGRGVAPPTGKMDCVGLNLNESNEAKEYYRNVSSFFITGAGVFRGMGGFQIEETHLDKQTC